MAAELEPWASALAYGPDLAAQFEVVAGKLKTSPAALLRAMTVLLVELDGVLQAHGLGGVKAWTGPPGSGEGGTSAAEPETWAATLALDPDPAASVERIAGELNTTAGGLLRKMSRHIVDLDRDLEANGRGGVASWANFLRGDVEGYAAEAAFGGLELRIRPTEFMWPSDKPFPWTAEECKAAVLGYEVKWPGSFDDFLQRLRGRWEMSDGYGVLWQA
jgi:hypothetical protein